MRASEARDKLDELINEFGDYTLKMPDQLEATWLNDVTDVRYERDRDAMVVVSED